MIFDAEIVWACAVAVNRRNDGYFKEDLLEYDSRGDARITKRANKLVVKNMLREQDYSSVTAADREEGIALRHHFTGYLLKEVAGTINDFEKTVLRISQMDELTSRNLLEFAIISCLPAAYLRDLDKQKLKREIFESTPIEGEYGDYILGDLIVVKSYYNINYDKHKITGRFGESFVDFWFKEDLAMASTIKIKGKIKQHRPDGTTQLNYVKEIKN